MIHYIVLMEEKNFQANSFYTKHFYKKGEGNETPIFIASTDNFEYAQKALIQRNFKETEKLTIEEIILHDVSEITILFFNIDGSFDRTGIYRRVAS